MKAYLIARVSTDDQKDALPAQTFRLTEYARKLQADYELFEIRESAYKGNRDEFKQLVRRIKDNPSTSVVVFDKIDRYTRDSSSSEVRELDLLRKKGKIEIHFPSDNLFISKSSPATDLLRLGMGIVVAQYYSDSISDNVKRRFEQKLRDGEWIGTAPFGYVNAADVHGKRWINIVPEDAQIVREGFELYATGLWTLRAIAAKWRKDYGLNVGSSKIDQILKNPFYYGVMRVKGQLYPHAYKPIVSKKLFDEVKKVSEGYKVIKRQWAGIPFPYRGLITCSECGCLITFEIKKKTYTYGHCTQKKFKHPHVYVNETNLTQTIATTFDKLAIPDKILKDVFDAIKEKKERSKSTRESQMRTLENKTHKLNKRLERLYEDYLDERISREFHDRLHKEIIESINDLRIAKKGLELKPSNELDEFSSLLELANSIGKLFKSGTFEEKRELVKLTHSNLILEGRELRWNLKEPFNLMVLCNESQNWLRRLGSNQRPNR